MSCDSGSQSEGSGSAPCSTCGTSSVANCHPTTRRRRALIVVDVQYDFMVGGSLAVSTANDVLTPIAVLREKLDFEVTIFSQDYHPEHHASFASSHPGCAMFSTITLEKTGVQQTLWPDHCLKEQHGCFLHRDLFARAKCASHNHTFSPVPVEGAAPDEHRFYTCPCKDSYLVRKGYDPLWDSYSAFYVDGGKGTRTYMEALLREHCIDDVYVCGLATDYCVCSTAHDAKAAGFNTYLIQDAARGVATDTTTRELDKLENEGVQMTHTAQLLGVCSGHHKASHAAHINCFCAQLQYAS